VIDFLFVLAVALLPSGGNVAGALIAEWLKVPSWVIGAALHSAAGIAIALVSVDLMPRILDHVPTWPLVAAFLGGAIFSVLLARGVGLARSLIFAKGSHGAWMVYMAVAADLLSDGLMTGAGSAASSRLGLLLALSQVFANLPGGFAAMANFREDGVPRRRRLLITASFALPVFPAPARLLGPARHARDRALHRPGLRRRHPAPRHY
jgi:ZIP family zinc transporter